jgi:hypothetical protein
MDPRIRYYIENESVHALYSNKGFDHLYYLFDVNSLKKDLEGILVHVQPVHFARGVAYFNQALS